MQPNFIDFERHRQALALYKHLNENQLRHMKPATVPLIANNEMDFTRETLKGVAMKRIESF